MKGHGVDRYEMPDTDGLIVTVTAKSNVKVKRKNDAAEPSENGHAEE